MNKEKIFIKQLENFTASYPKFIDLSLERVLNLLNKLGNPHLNLPPVIHVAGTNGKGSTIAYISSIFKQNNKNVHIYTSPHLVSIKERIIISNKYVSITKLIETLNYCAKINEDNPITQFEMLTVIAFYLMSKKSADVAIIETGLGGRLDATNVILKPLLTIITTISYDHMEFLGNTIEAIAGEKAGIMKEKVFCISAPQERTVEKVLIKKAKKIDAKLLLNRRDWNFSKFDNKIHIHFHNRALIIPKPKMKGSHQTINAALASMAFLCIKNFKVTIDNINLGILRAKWPGRLEEIKTGYIRDIFDSSSEIWVDGGHNISGANAIADWLGSYKTKKYFDNFVLICGFLKNKDAENMIIKFKDKINKIIFVPIEENQNSYSTKKLSKIASSLNMQSAEFNSLTNAILTIKNMEKTIFVVFGSLYLAGEVYKINRN